MTHPHELPAARDDAQSVRPSRGPRFESAEQALARELREADRKSPDWDLEPRIVTAVGALERGMDVDLVRRTYGEKIFALAAARLSTGAIDVIHHAHWHDLEKAVG